MEAGPDSVTLYLPSNSCTEIPDELPSNEDGVGLLPSTVIVKSDGLLSPPPSLITFLVTIMLAVVTGGEGSEYVLVIVHLLFSPSLILPEHSLDKAEV